MRAHIDVDKAIQLLSKRSTTVEDLCKFLYEDINQYQELRQEFYLEEFETAYRSSQAGDMNKTVQEQTELIISKVEQDVIIFTVKYAEASIDAVLDAINEKKIKSKRSSTNLLVLLSSLKEINEEI
jgi:hypothetical protein